MSLLDFGAFGNAIRNIDQHLTPETRTLDQVLALLRRYRYPISTETALQLAVATVLTDAGIGYQREVVFGPENRLDFYLPHLKLALELKIKGSAAEVTRQLFRYAKDERVAVIVLMTSRHTHAAVPHEMNGKAIAVITLWEGEEEQVRALLRWSQDSAVAARRWSCGCCTPAGCRCSRTASSASNPTPCAACPRITRFSPSATAAR
jgi:hypothetical protein